jgi:hypothetical protein
MNVIDKVHLVMLLERTIKKHNVFHKDIQLSPLVEILEKRLDCRTSGFCLLVDDEITLVLVLGNKNETSG